jgi:hypothetical protein
MRKTLIFIFTLFFLAGCTSAAAPSVPPKGTATLVPNATFTQKPTDTPIPTDTPTLTATALRTPPALPGLFQTSILGTRGTPHTNLQNTCQYLRDKWSSLNSPPGTVVMPIMFHSVGSETIGNQISEDGFHTLIQALHDNGFQTITTTQLADFLETNAKIPSRSVILILDDRRQGTVALDFMPYLNEYNWTLTLAWPIGAGDNSTDKKPANNVLPGENFTSLWEQIEAYNASGKLDIQAHGVVHNIGMGPDATDQFITSELQGSIDALRQHFNNIPIAIIWPNGDFSPLAAEIARKLGYRMGFTVNPRGPLMFNWIPLADTKDPQRPTWYPEGDVHDPLMVLPRYWDTDAIIHLKDVIQIGQDASGYAEQNKATELEYYDIACFPLYGSIP